MATTYKGLVNLALPQEPDILYTFELPFGTCSTAQSTTKKVVDSDSFLLLETGSRILVKFSYGAVASATLKVENTDEKTIKISGSNTTADSWKANDIVEFVYDGTYWNIVNSQYSLKHEHNYAPFSHASESTEYGSATANYYGHAKASSTTPKAAGTASVGSETSSFARGDHVHPLQTSVTGSAGSVSEAITFNNSGKGEASETTYNGSTPRTISYNTIGAAPGSHTSAKANSSTWGHIKLEYDSTKNSLNIINQ